MYHHCLILRYCFAVCQSLVEQSSRSTRGTLLVLDRDVIASCVKCHPSKDAPDILLRIAQHSLHVCISRYDMYVEYCIVLHIVFKNRIPPRLHPGLFILRVYNPLFVILTSPTS